MFVIVILSIIPVIIWVFMEPLGLRFLNLNTFTTSLGQVLGLVGMVLFSVTLILAGRLKFLDKYFKGLDKVYSNHHKFGAIAFSFLLFHPLFLVVKYITISIREAGLFFVPFINMPITWGIISLTLMIIFLSLTFYVNLKYHIWKMSHKFMTVIFVFAILHAFFISSDISRNSLLKYYILSLAFVGLAVSIHQVFLGKFLAKKYKYKIKSINELNRDIVEIEMEPFNKKMIFSPGQFAFFKFLGGGVTSESHPFSISSTSEENNLKITVKNLGDFTSLLNNLPDRQAGLKINDEVLIDGPYGNFFYRKTSNKNQIWVAGGIGITPFLSMAQNLDNEYNVDLYYSVGENKEAVYLNNLQEISQKNDKFRFNLWDVKEKGYITGGLVSDLSNGLDSKDIFLCGPPSFMESLKNQFISLGIDTKKIYYENFSL